MNNNTPKIKPKTKKLKRPLSYVDKKTQYSESDFLIDLSSNVSMIKKFYLEYKKNEKKVDEKKNNLTFRKFFHKNKSIYLKKLDKAKYLIYKNLYDKKLENKRIQGLSDLLLVKNESASSRTKINDNSSSQISSAVTYFDINMTGKKNLYNNNHNKKQQYNNFNKILDNKGYNYFNDEKNIIIKKTLLDNSYTNKENKRNKKKEEIFIDKQNNFEKIKNTFFKYKNSSNNSIKIKNIPYNDPELHLNNTEDNKEKTKINIIDNFNTEDNKEKTNINIIDNINTEENKEKNNINIIDNINTETKNEIRAMKIKNKYLIKFGDLFDNYKNLSSNLEWIKVEYKNNFLNIINNILKSFKEYNKLIMYKFNSRDILSLDTWSKSLKTFYDICNNIIQCQKIIIEEIIITKNNNIELHKKLRALESKLNSYNEDIKEKNKDIIQNETNSIENNKSKTSKNENKCNNESKYILTIYNLKKEIKDLCQELNRSKSDKNTINEFKMKLNSLNEDIKQSKNNDEENQIKNKEKIAFLMQYNSELKEEINELQNEIDELKSKESKYIDKIIILENKCSHFNKEINEKNKNIIELKNDIKKLTEVKKPQILGPINTVFVPCE